MEDFSGDGDPLPSLGCRPVGATLDKQVKSRIWAGKYVNLASLLCRKPSYDKMIVEFSNSCDVRVKHPTNESISFPDWQEAFGIYCLPSIQ